MLRVAKKIFAIVLALVSSSADSFEVEAWSLPSAITPAAQPDLVMTPDGDWLLAWVEKGAAGEHALRFSRSTRSGKAESRWQPPQTIASGKDWFVNWADTPHLIALGDGSLWAHWLRRNGGGAYDYGIALVRSDDAGRNWSAPIRVEPEGAKNDYGFVTMWPHARDALGIAWLDSRAKPVAEDVEDSSHDHSGHGAGAMMLRAAVFNASGKRNQEWPLDASTCDCCTTASALTKRGPVLVYRGRGKGEIRDTRLVRFENERWTQPLDVYADGWQFAGCPVNGPAVAARGNDVWVAWYTEADGKPSLRLARSRNAGDSFAKPLHIAEGEGVLGRAALAMDAKNIWLAWLVERTGSGNGQELWLARLDQRSGQVADKQRVANVLARGRASGLPRIGLRDGVAHLIWTDVVDGQARLQGLRVR